MEALKIFLNSAAGQHIQRVYLNNKMEWLFAPRPGYEKMLLRGEVLAYEDIPLQPVGSNGKTPAKAAVEKENNSLSVPPKPKHSNRF